MRIPDLQEGLLDDAMLGALFFDIQSAASGLSVQLKGAPRQNAELDPCSLEHALSQLRAGSVAGAQLRYVHQGQAWCDTILPVGGRFRLIRVSLDQVAAIEE